MSQSLQKLEVFDWSYLASPWNSIFTIFSMSLFKMFNLKTYVKLLHLHTWLWYKIPLAFHVPFSPMICSETATHIFLFFVQLQLQSTQSEESSQTFFWLVKTFDIYHLPARPCHHFKVVRIKIIRKLYAWKWNQNASSLVSKKGAIFLKFQVFSTLFPSYQTSCGVMHFL